MTGKKNFCNVNSLTNLYKEFFMYDALASWSSSYLPPILYTWGGAAIGTLLNPFTANRDCRTVSVINPLIPSAIGGVGLITHLWNASLHRRIKNAIKDNPSIEFSDHQIVSERVWHSLRHISYLVSGLGIGTSGMELAQLIFVCTLSSEITPVTVTALQIPFLAVALWNTLALQQVKTESPLAQASVVPDTASLSSETAARAPSLELHEVSLRLPDVVEWR